MKNHVTGSFILNPKGKEASSRTFTALGLEWEHAAEETKDSLKTSGPLPEAIAVLVSLLACNGLSCPLCPLSQVCGRPNAAVTCSRFHGMRNGVWKGSPVKLGLVPVSSQHPSVSPCIVAW